LPDPFSLAGRCNLVIGPGKRRMHISYLQRAIEMASENLRRGGGPFAALVVKDGVVIASGCNQVTRTNDPTAHAEIVAVREACRVLGTFQLSGCDVYCSCEPCPMCLGALFWARPAKVVFAATREDAARAGFDDSLIYSQIAVAPQDRTIPMIPIALQEARKPFEEWCARSERTDY
jgi:guanine deaminase